MKAGVEMRAYDRVQPRSDRRKDLGVGVVTAVDADCVTVSWIETPGAPKSRWLTSDLEVVEAISCNCGKKFSNPRDIEKHSSEEHRRYLYPPCHTDGCEKTAQVNYDGFEICPDCVARWLQEAHRENAAIRTQLRELQEKISFVDGHSNHCRKCGDCDELVEILHPPQNETTLLGTKDRTR